jgi:hypothetical protein
VTQERFYQEEHKEHEGESHAEERANRERIAATIIVSGLSIEPSVLDF